MQRNIKAETALDRTAVELTSNGYIREVHLILLIWIWSVRKKKCPELMPEDYKQVYEKAETQSQLPPFDKIAENLPNVFNTFN